MNTPLLLIRAHLYLQASSPIQQLELITDLLGTPSASDMKFACDAARRHMLQRGSKPNNLGALYTLGSSATHEAVHLLCQVCEQQPFHNVDTHESTKGASIYDVGTRGRSWKSGQSKGV